MSDEARQRFWRRLRVAAFVAGAAYVSTTLYVLYLPSAFGERIEARAPGMSVEDAVRLDITMIAFSVILSALVGAFFSERYRLAGVGSLNALKASLRVVLPMGVVFCLVGYFLFGRPLAEKVPGTYPEEVIWALGMTFKGAVYDEVVARYGMMTIVSGVTSRRWLANVLQATFFTALVFKGLSFFGLSAEWDLFFVSSLVGVFVTHLALGAVYARYGLFSAIALHLLVDSKFVLHALLV